MKKNGIKFETICAAKNGDGMAMETIIRHFSPLINRLARETGTDVHGNPFEAVNEDVRTQLEIKLITEIVRTYDLNRQPPKNL